MSKTVREQLLESRPMTSKEVQQMMDDVREEAKKRPMMFAAKKKTNRPANCYLCGTSQDIIEIRYGQIDCNIQQSIIVCDKCRKWLGNFLLSEESQIVAPPVAE